jgi:hypothetical protein
MAQSRTGRFVWRGFLIVILLVVADFMAANLADRMLRNRDRFFETIAAEADLTYKTSEEAGSYLYQECAWHRVLLVYRCTDLLRAFWCPEPRPLRRSEYPSPELLAPPAPFDALAQRYAFRCARQGNDTVRYAHERNSEGPEK